ncbi:MAG TPA: glycosyltransferase family 2 protein [Vicinamibacterales bacterium]|jgi:glycosyltransferase involved in cell wall biosynthesis|nr:glycosyltransferase family 2 protein [Vicinamibacterales bacterium]
MQIWIVVAAYNEADRLEATLRDLLATGYDIVVVDDGSTDSTRSIAARFPVWTLRHPINCGQGAAIRTGIAFALDRGAQIIVTFDADGQHDASDIPGLVAPIVERRTDVVLGSRFLGGAIGMPLGRRLLLTGARWFTRLVARVAVSDPQNGMRALSRHAAREIRIAQDGMAHASEIVEQLPARRLRYCEAPVTVRYTPATLAKGQRPWNALRIVGHLIAGRMIK